jgi:alpha-ribazole phosphatase
MAGRVILVRHGEPAGHVGRCVGQFDVELAAAAPIALQVLARTMASSPIVLSSDLRRAAHSASILARAWNAKLRFDPRIREVSFGDWEGRPWMDIAREDAATMNAWGADWVRCAPPNGETGDALAARARAALHDVVRLADDASADVVVVSHAGWIRVATTVLLGEPLALAFDRTIDYAHAAVFALDGSRATLSHWNVAALPPPARDVFVLRPAPSSARP